MIIHVHDLHVMGSFNNYIYILSNRFHIIYQNRNMLQSYRIIHARQNHHLSIALHNNVSRLHLNISSDSPLNCQYFCYQNWSHLYRTLKLKNLITVSLQTRPIVVDFLFSMHFYSTYTSQEEEDSHSVVPIRLRCIRTLQGKIILVSLLYSNVL